MNDVVNFLCEIFCLEAGILGRSIALNWEENAIDEAFQTMDPAEVRKLKRKFRKVARKMIPKERWNLMSRRQKRTVVMREMFMRAWQESIKMNRDISDNDP